MNETPIPASITTIQTANWAGFIPIVLSLAPSSVSSPVAPRPLHKLVSRISYLHLALIDEVLQLYEYAPTVNTGRDVLTTEEPPEEEKLQEFDKSLEQRQSETEVVFEATPIQTKHRDTVPICWFEDETSGEPLRWHLFIGVLYDLIKGRSILQHSSRGLDNEWTLSNSLPWRIRVHFTAFPMTLHSFEIGNLSNNETCETEHNDSSSNELTHPTLTNPFSPIIGRIFRNSLKQALFMQYSSSKVAMSITKSSHEKLWDAILSTNYNIYTEVNGTLQIGLAASDDNATTAVAKDDKVPDLLPVRVMLNSNSPMQKPCRAYKDVEYGEEVDNKECNNDDGLTEDEKTLSNLVKHLSTCNVRPYTTLGDVLLSWLPQHFRKDSADEVVANSLVHYYIQGVQPCLKCSIFDLWKSMCHPDHFLYIIVVTKK